MDNFDTEVFASILLKIAAFVGAFFILFGIVPGMLSSNKFSEVYTGVILIMVVIAAGITFLLCFTTKKGPKE